LLNDAEVTEEAGGHASPATAGGEALGTQLCWQVFIDNSGAFLGVAELMHIAKRDDLTSQIVPAEAPVLLPLSI
jgi:hypothetical protein